MRPRAAVVVAAWLLLVALGAAQQPEAPPAPAADLVRDTLATDIQSADYYELVAWCRTLGLPETGNRAELQARLYAHFGVAAPPEPAKPVRVIIVESARSTDYFTLEGVKEDYLILEGDVRVEFRDTGAGVSHRVAAERLIVNQTRRTLSASGGVSYELVRKTGAPEIFRGESFTFDMAGWGGLILDGRGQSERTLEEGSAPVTFYYRGVSIIRRENETVILRDGSVTSSVAEDPYWQIAASRIWVLGPGEWAIRAGVLQVGRVPLFYLPFFYKPGDEILVHPSLGYRNREGSFIQTTTYLIGEAEQKPGTLSFLRLTGDDDSYDTEVEGIFLHKVKKEAKAGEGAAPTDGGKDILKVMVDYYSRLGGFAGLLLVLDPVWTLKGGIGWTRTLFESGGVYRPFDVGSTKSEWNTVDFGAAEIPFRFGFEGGVALTGKPGSMQASLGLFSDPFFPSDFYNRAEKIDWTGLLAGPDAAQAEVKPGGLDPTERQNLSWTLTGRYKAAVAPPWLDSFEIPKVDLALYWQGRDNADYDSQDPARRFFAPTRLVAPDLRLRLTGTLYQTEQPGAAAAGAKPGGGGEELRVPQPADAEEPAPEEPEIRLPAPLPDLAGLDTAYSPASFQVGYSVEPRVLFESQYNQQDWTTPSAIDFEFLYSSLEISGSSRLQSAARVWDERLELKTGLAVDGVYRGRFNRSGSYYDESSTRRAEWDNLLLRDYQATRLDAGPTVDIALLPLLDRRALAQTRLTYGLSWDLFSLDYAGPITAPLAAGYDPQYDGRLFGWDADTVKRHEVAGRFSYKPGLAIDFLDLRADLPPRSGYYRGEADLTVGFSRTNAKGGYREINDEWVYDPLVVTETLDPAAWVQAVGRLEFDLNAQELDVSDNTLRLLRLSSASGGWLLEQRVVLETMPRPITATIAQTTLSALGFTARFLAERRVPVKWQGDPTNAFVATGAGERMLPAEASLAYKAPSQPIFIWHNRIRLVPLVTSSLLFDLYRFTGSRLDITTGISARIYRFIDLDLSITSYNNKLYRYVKAWAEEIPEPWVNPFEDLVRSYSFLNEDERRLSAFKLRSINVKATHDLGDWNLAVEYSGSQKLQSKPGGGDEYVWTPVFSIVIQWKPIPEIRREVRKDTEGLSVRG